MYIKLNYPLLAQKTAFSTHVKSKQAYTLLLLLDKIEKYSQ